MVRVDTERVRTTFEVDGRVVGTTFIRRGAGFFDEVFSVAHDLAWVHEKDVEIYADGHPLVPAMSERERIGGYRYGSIPVLGRKRPYQGLL